MRTDEELYQDVLGGSKAAFEQLYERYEKPLFGFLLRRCRDHQDAEEVFHDVMIGVLREKDLSFAPGGFAAWIYRVALNLIANRQRNRGRAQARIADVQQWYGHNPGPEEQILSQEQESILAVASSSLTPALADVLHLRRDGKSYAESAEILGIPIGSVKSRVHALVAHLRKELAKWHAK